MSRFIAHYRSATMASIATRTQQQTVPLPKLRFEFTDEHAVVILVDELQRIDDTNAHVGLNVMVEILASSEQEAENKSKAMAENLLLLITYSTLAFCGSAELISFLSFDRQPPGLRAHVRPFDNGEYMASRVIINEQELGEIFSAVNASAERSRVMRSLSWLRKGINEDNFVDEFIGYWVGLEVVKSVLRRMLKMKTKNPGDWDGIKDIYENDLHLAGFEKVEEARNKLLHGYEELSNSFIEEIQRYVEPTRRTLIASISRVLKLTATTQDSIQTKSVRRSRRKPWMVIQGELHGLPNTLEQITDAPPIIKGEPQTAVTTNEKGELEAKVDLSLRFDGPPGVRFVGGVHEHCADQESGISKIELVAEQVAILNPVES